MLLKTLKTRALSLECLQKLGFILIQPSYKIRNFVFLHKNWRYGFQEEEYLSLRLRIFFPVMWPWEWQQVWLKILHYPLMQFIWRSCIICSKNCLRWYCWKFEVKTLFKNQKQGHTNICQGHTNVCTVCIKTENEIYLYVLVSLNEEGIEEL